MVLVFPPFFKTTESELYGVRLNRREFLKEEEDNIKKNSQFSELVGTQPDFSNSKLTIRGECITYT